MLLNAFLQKLKLYWLENCIWHFEQEAYLLKEEDGTILTAYNSHCFSTVGVDIQEEFVQNFVYSLEKMGVETEQISSEYGPGQLEINLKYAPALKAADDQVTFMHLFKQIARVKGMIGTLNFTVLQNV
ncbi:hypothetical protein SB782_16125 [Brevibacillus sp. SIMBA_076]